MPKLRHVPAHIDPSKLPNGIWYDPRGDRWRTRQLDEATGKAKKIRLCSGQATLSQIWQAFEARQHHATTTFKSLSLDFQKSLKWRELSPLTQSDYRHCHAKICASKTKNGDFGDQPITKWTTATVLKYRDFRGEDSKSRANKELAYIKRVLSWAMLYELITINPSDGVPKLTVPPRQHYAEDKDYQFLLQTARESGYWYLAPLLTISYECGLRLCEAVALTDACERQEGLRIVGRKGSKTNIIQWGAELKAAWDEAKAKRAEIWQRRKQPSPIDPARRHLFISERTGDPIRESSVKTAKERVDKQAKAKAERLGLPYTHFTIHDVKRRAVSDYRGSTSEKMDASRHKTLGMMQVYDVKEKIVKPTSED